MDILTPVTKRCDGCDHWKELWPVYDKDNVVVATMGRCRKRAPKVAINPNNGAAKTVWPQLLGDDRCDEWKERVDG